MRLSLLEIIEATGGGEVGGTQVGETFSTFHTDSREVKQGGVFFALRGQEMDGTEFVADAIARGAAAVVVQRKTEIPSGIVEILVSDTWKALYELASALPEEGLAVLNADNDFYPLLAQMTPARVAGFGSDHGDYRVESFQALEDGGSQFTVRGVEVRLTMAGRHQALNAVAALAAGDFAGVPVEAGSAALAGVTIDHRLQEMTTPHGYSIIDDAYNASPESMLAAFDAVADGPRQGRLLAVLGEMRELGSLSEESHRRVGQRAAEVFDAVCVVDGDRAKPMAQAAGAELVPDRAGAAEWVRRNAASGDRVLIKASHGVRLDELVRELTSA